MFRLFERQCAASIQPFSASTPTIYDLLKCHRFAGPRLPRATGRSSRREPRIPSSPRTVGARSASVPASLQFYAVRGEHERHGVRRVCGVRADTVGLEHRLGVPVIGCHEADAAERRASPRPRGRGRRRPPRPHATTAGITPVCPTMSGFAKLTTQKPIAVAAAHRRPRRRPLRPTSPASGRSSERRAATAPGCASRPPTGPPRHR